MPNRRRFLQGISTVPFLGNVGRSAPVKRDYLTELGVRFHVIEQKVQHGLTKPAPLM